MIVAPGVFILLVVFAVLAVFRPEGLSSAIDKVGNDFGSGAERLSSALDRRLVSLKSRLTLGIRDAAGGASAGASAQAPEQEVPQISRAGVCQTFDLRNF